MTLPGEKTIFKEVLVLLMDVYTTVSHTPLDLKTKLDNKNQSLV